jgi:hypothetical protein
MGRTEDTPSLITAPTYADNIPDTDVVSDHGAPVNTYILPDNIALANPPALGDRRKVLPPEGGPQKSGLRRPTRQLCQPRGN